MQGRRAAPTPEERKAIVDAYRRLGRIRDTAQDPSVPYGPVVVARVLHEEGVMKKRRGDSPVIRLRDDVRELIMPLWMGGASYREMNEAITEFGAKKVRDSTIRRIMEGVPRGSPQRGVRRLDAGISVSPDPIDRAWLSGVFDARGRVQRVNSAKGVAIEIAAGSSYDLGREIARVVGGGSVKATPSGMYTYQLFRIDAVVLMLEAIEPFLRGKHILARRIIDDMKRRDQGLDTE